MGGIFMPHFRRILLRLSFLTWMTLVFAGTGFSIHPVHAHESPTVPADEDVTGEHRALIEREIEVYNTAFPDIQFIHLEGDGAWHGEMVALVTALGSDSSPLDYEHPPELRQQLMGQTLERLVIMLRRNIISATAFGLGEDSLIGRRNLCVVTLNPARTFPNDLEATRYMLDMPEETVERVNTARHLRRLEHLQFAIDHEVFHCLDSILYGGAPMTHEDSGGEYNSFLRESAADAFALALHIKDRKEITPYARNITHIRALWLVSSGLNRCTFESLREIHRIGPDRLGAMSVREIADLAHDTAERVVGSYENYVARRVATLKAARILGLDSKLQGEVWKKLETQKADEELVGLLVNRYRYYSDHLFTDKPLPLEAPSFSTASEKQ